MVRSALSTLVSAILLVSSCGGGPADLAPSGPAQFTELTVLPDLPHAASTLAPINGVDYVVAGNGATGDDPAVLLDATGLTHSWALYSFGVTPGMTLINLTVDVEELSGKYWIGLSDYGDTNTWEFHGPFSTATAVSLAGTPSPFVSKSGNLYWVVVAPAGTSLRLISSTVNFDAPAPRHFYVPPAGMQTVAAPPVSDPSLVIMTAIPDVAEEGAPVIFYTAGDNETANTWMAWYNGTAWESELLDANQRYTMARAHWTGTEGIIACYYNGAGGFADPSQIVRLVTDGGWHIDAAESEPMGGSYNRKPTMLAMDHDVATRRTAVITTYPQDLMDASVDVLMITDTGSGSFGDTAIVGDVFGGVDIAFDPDPLDDGGWAMYSSGTYDTSEILLLDFQIKYARLEDMVWSWQPGNYIDHNSPLALDLHYAAAGQPELLMISARDWDIPFVGITASLFYDVVLGTYNGTGWDFSNIHTSTIFPNIIKKTMVVDLGADVSWAAPEALHFANVDGTVDFDINPTFAITGGDLLNHANYLTGTGGVYSGSAYFTGDPGITHSWATGPGGPACAYINVEQVNVDDILSGDLTGIAADLVYWSPES